DDLMRLFATGAMSWVMDRTFPDDVPLEAKMVTRAIERAQRTVEDRNFEIRKDVLKYDEVMNEQRKVIYLRRQQILDGEDLREETVLAIQESLGRVVGQSCTGEFPEDWNLEELELNLHHHLPTEITKADLEQALHIEQLRELVVDEGLALYAAQDEK